MNKRSFDIITGQVVPELLSEYILRTIALELAFISESKNSLIINNAKKLEEISPELWKNNQWVRALGGANIENCNIEGWRDWFIQDMWEEMEEYENENKQSEEPRQET